MKPVNFLFFVIIFFSQPVFADLIKGDLTPGGLIHAFLPPNSSATLNGKNIFVASDGLLVFGFGRNAKKRQILVVKTADGKIKHRSFQLKPRKYLVQRIDGLPKNMVTPPQAYWARIKHEAKILNTVRRLTSKRRDFLNGFIWPVKGRVSGVYGSQRILNGKPSRPHSGIDIAAPQGTLIRAAASGKILLSHPGMFYTGKTIVIDHGCGVSTIYIHLSKIVIREGQEVKKGAIIGEVGETGRATGPHLHWGLTWNGVNLDPSLVVRSDE